MSTLPAPRSRLWLGGALGLTGMILLAACQAGSQATGSEALPLVVEFAGCETVLAGPICTLPSAGKLTLWIATAPQAEIAIDGQVQRPLPPEILGGRRFEIEVREGALEVEARQGGRAASFRLALARASEPDWYRDAWALGAAGNDEGARRLAAVRAGSASPSERGLALRILARLDRRRGEGEREEHHLRQAILALEESGLRSAAVEDTIVLAYSLLDQWRLTEVRSLLSSLRPPEGHGESAYLLELYTGLVASKSGDLRTALRSLGAAAAGAERLGLDEKRIQAEEVLALELHRLGRFDEAAALFVRLPGPEIHQALAPCTRAQLLNNRAWALLLASEAGLEIEPAVPLLQRALEIFDRECGDYPAERVNVRLNLALAHLQEGRLGMAESWLDEARALSPEPLPELMLWAWDIEARLRLAGARPREALALYDELARRTANILAPEAEWRLAYWRAQTLEAMGEVPAALASYGKAEALLDQELLLVPMHEGRDTFLGQRERATRRHLELLQQSGDHAAALGLARRAHSRYLRSLRRSLQFASLPVVEREAWDRALAARRVAREGLEKAAAQAWRLPGDQLDSALAQSARSWRAQLAQLDSSLARLGTGSQTAEPRALVFAPGEVLLAFYPLGEDWAGFAADRAGVEARRIEDLDPAVRPPEELAARLLEPFASALERSRAVRVLASGSLAAVDFHRLPFQGEILLASHSVAYGLDLATQPAAEAAGAARALILADPEGDLPGAREEAESVAAALRDRHWEVERLEGTAATGAAVRSALPQSGVLHYAGHAVFAGWESFLPLAAGGRLTLDDLLSLKTAPAWVVLSGCETAATRPLAGVETIGLAHAFLAAGSRAVIAASRPVSDETTTALMQALYREWGPGMSPGEALRRAQLGMLATDPEADWASFRVYVP